MSVKSPLRKAFPESVCLSLTDNRRCARPHDQFLRSYAVPALQDCKLVVVARMRCGEGGEDLSKAADAASTRARARVRVRVDLY